MKENNSSSFSLEDALDCIFELLLKRGFLTPEEIPSARNSFSSYLYNTNPIPFTDDKDYFCNQIESVISTWPKDKITYPFLKSELKSFFSPIPNKPWFNFLTKYQPVFVFVSIFIPIIIAIVQIFISNK